jgi:hypothetical protein
MRAKKKLILVVALSSLFSSLEFCQKSASRDLLLSDWRL